jgi:membrane-bound ClpP family serine protease
MNKKAKITPKKAAAIAFLLGGLYLIVIDQPIAGFVFVGIGFALLVSE